MKGKLFRLAHLGWVDESDLIVGLATLERVLARLGVPVELGAAVGAAQRIFAKEG
jgi:aspartate aminotransferase-like enzyme